jgi:hypothetical protein
VNRTQEQAATEAMEQMRQIGRLTMAAVVEQTQHNIERIVRKPADPLAVMLDGALSDLRQIRDEVDDAIEQIEQVKREWERRRPVVVGGGVARTDGRGAQSVQLGDDS